MPVTTCEPVGQHNARPTPYTPSLYPGAPMAKVFKTRYSITADHGVEKQIYEILKPKKYNNISIVW